MSLVWESIFEVQWNDRFVCENGVTHMGTYSKEIQVLWELKDRLWGSWTCSLINSDSPSSRPAPWQGVQWERLPLELPLWSLNRHFGDFVFHAESLFHSKTNGQWRLFPPGGVYAQCEQLVEQLRVEILLCRKQPWAAAKVALRTQAYLWGWLSAWSLASQSLGHKVSPSASSSPATPLPPGCWMLLYLRQAASGCIRYKSLFSLAHQEKKKKKIKISRKVYIEGQSILSLLLTWFFSAYSTPSKDERRLVRHALITHRNHCMWMLIWFS